MTNKATLLPWHEPVSRAPISAPECILPVLRFCWDAHRPSWLRYGSGTASLELRGHTRAGWLSIYAAEFGEKASKRVMLAMHPDDVVKLRDQLTAYIDEVDRRNS